MIVEMSGKQALKHGGNLGAEREREREKRERVHTVA